MIKLEHTEKKYSGFGTIYNLWIAITDKLGKFNIIKREVYQLRNAVAVLLYNREKDTVILTNQMRAPILFDDNKRTDSYEVVAGLCEEGMTDIEVAKMEAMQEVGYQIEPQKISTFYTSPGIMSGTITLFYAEVRDSDKVAEGGGLEEENENIEIKEPTFQHAMESLDKGKIDDAKTIIALQWLQLHLISEGLKVLKDNKKLDF